MDLIQEWQVTKLHILQPTAQVERHTHRYIQLTMTLQLLQPGLPQILR